MSQQQEFAVDLNEVVKNLLNYKKLEDFITKYSVKGIVGAGFLATKDQDIYNRVEKTIKAWIRHDKLYAKFLFSDDKDDQEVLTLLMTHPQCHMRAIVAECIDLHAYEVGEVLKVNEMHPLFESYLFVLIHLLSDSEAEVALKILRALKKMVKREDYVGFMSGQFWLSKVQQGIENEDKVIALRFMELIMMMSNLNEHTHQKLVQIGLLEKAIDLYSTDDLLVKLNAIELFGSFGEREYNAKYLAQHKITPQILQEAFDTQQDLFVRKYALLLVVKMISNSAMKMTPILSKDILKFLNQLLSSKSQEEIASAFEIISFLCIRQEGINLLISDRQMLKSFVEFATGNRVELRKKCVNAFTHILVQTPTNPKQTNVILNLMMCYSNPSLTETIGDFKSDPDNLEPLNATLSQIETGLFSPFEDIELDYMYLLKNCFLYEVIALKFIQLSRSVEYLASHHAKNKIIFDMKATLRKNILHICKSNIKKHKSYELFLDNYNKELSNKTQNNQEMSYDTATL